MCFSKLKNDYMLLTEEVLHYRKHKEKKFIIPLLRDNNNLMFRCLIIFMCTCLFKNRTGKKPELESNHGCVCMCVCICSFSHLRSLYNNFYMSDGCKTTILIVAYHCIISVKNTGIF